MNGILPNFLIIGAQKSGTTTIQEWLSQHPDVFIPNPLQNKLLKTGRGRELQFFYDENKSNVSNWSKGLNWYKSQFYNWDIQKAIGEKSPSYLYYIVCPERIFKTLGKIKLIATLRHPVDRAYSAYWMAYQDDFGSFEEKVYDSIWLEQGHYDEQLKRYLRYYEKEDFYICTLKQVKENPEHVFKELCLFLDINPSFTPDNLHKKYKVGREGDSRVKDVLRVKGGYRPMDKEIREELIEHFKPHNEELKKMFPELDIEHWSR